MGPGVSGSPDKHLSRGSRERERDYSSQISLLFNTIRLGSNCSVSPLIDWIRYPHPSCPIESFSSLIDPYSPVPSDIYRCPRKKRQTQSPWLRIHPTISRRSPTLQSPHYRLRHPPGSTSYTPPRRHSPPLTFNDSASNRSQEVTRSARRLTLKNVSPPKPSSLPIHLLSPLSNSLFSSGETSTQLSCSDFRNSAFSFLSSDSNLCLKS